MMARNRPPVAFVVDEKKRASRLEGLQSHGNSNRFSNNQSSRSFASSITWGSVDDDYDDDEDDSQLWDSSAFDCSDDQRPGIPHRQATVASITEAAAGMGIDARPCIPARQQSMGMELAQEEVMAELAAQGALDARPCLPTRQKSVGTELVMDEVLAEMAAEGLLDEAPSRPTRQQSSGTVKLAELQAGDAAPSIPARQQSVASTLKSGSAAFTLMGTTEPTLDYLQPETSQEFESKRKELTEKAEIFKRVVDIRDRKYNLKTYKQCFIGCEAVDRIIEAGLAETREDAVDLGRNWIKFLGLFRHVCDDHDFKDKHLFYKFSDPSEKTSTSKSSKKKKPSKSALPKIKRPWYSSTREHPAGPTIMEEQPMS